MFKRGKKKSAHDKHMERMQKHNEWLQYCLDFPTKADCIMLITFVLASVTILFFGR